MITFSQLISEKLQKPAEIEQFKKQVSHLSNVDSRDVEWQFTLPELMSKFGFNNVGSGKFGTVFINPNYPYVVKIFMRDTAYLKWLDFCKRNQGNKFVPKIKGKVVKVGNLFMAVRLEKLRPADLPFDLPADAEIYKAADAGDRDALAVVHFLEANDRLLDMHGQNVMRRSNGQLVVIDPFYNWYRGGKFTIDPDDVSNFKAIL